MMGTQGAAPLLKSHLAPQGAGDEGHLTRVFLVSSVSFFSPFSFLLQVLVPRYGYPCSSHLADNSEA